MSGTGFPDSGREAARERQAYVRHELRAPLAVMYPALTMLLEGSAGEPTPRQREYLEIIERNVMRLEGMVTSVADSGWSECAAVPAQPAVVSLEAGVEELTSSAQSCILTAVLHANVSEAVHDPRVHPAHH